MKLTIMRCHDHRVWAVSIDDEGGGHRVTPNKCCGSWSVVREWEFDRDDWKELAEEARKAQRRSKATSIK